MIADNKLRTSRFSMLRIGDQRRLFGSVCMTNNPWCNSQPRSKAKATWSSWGWENLPDVVARRIFRS